VRLCRGKGGGGGVLLSWLGLGLWSLAFAAPVSELVVAVLTRDSRSKPEAVFSLDKHSTFVCLKHCISKGAAHVEGLTCDMLRHGWRKA
jgi:hypothetical protein